jgi:ADP-ribose pyrophosphatase YjhB (NUDIX family)
MTEVICKFHFGVYGSLVKDGAILLIKKSRGPYSGRLDLPGGRLEHGETLEKALEREVLEETGLAISEFNLNTAHSCTVDYIDSNRQKISLHHAGIIYQVTSWEEKPVIKQMQYEDSLGAQWYCLDALREEALSPFARFVVDKESSPFNI